jgi:hypothetical protein
VVVALRVVVDVEAVTMQTIIRIILAKMAMMDGEVVEAVEAEAGVLADTVVLVG